MDTVSLIDHAADQARGEAQVEGVLEVVVRLVSVTIEQRQRPEHIALDTFASGQHLGQHIEDPGNLSVVVVQERQPGAAAGSSRRGLDRGWRPGLLHGVDGTAASGELLPLRTPIGLNHRSPGAALEPA